MASTLPSTWAPQASVIIKKPQIDGDVHSDPNEHGLNAIWHESNIDVVIDLAAVRRAAGVTQEQLAERLGSRQGQISRMEHQADLLLSTLIAYLRALGVGAELTVALPEGGTIHQLLTDRKKDDS